MSDSENMNIYNVYNNTKRALSSKRNPSIIVPCDNSQHMEMETTSINNYDTPNENICTTTTAVPLNNDNLVRDSDLTFELNKIHEDIFVKFVKNYYFPFQLRFHKYILLAWLIAFVICIIFGPAFLGMTKSSLDLPSNAPSVEAINAFTELYPGKVTVTVILIYKI